MKKFHGKNCIRTDIHLYKMKIHYLSQVFSEEEDKTYYYQYNGENLREISKITYVESEFGDKWGNISSQLEESNYSYIESIAKCWINEKGKKKIN
ncbi:hypothetical protein OL548_29480 [Lysinibacillus sp. MHQ-1]|nr:hypothetical protein OL548_29480 [Lysinibacillus sp. MHQ-1]